jgi:C4-dicarboxylate-specific signal transduction histidine kinase
VQLFSEHADDLASFLASDGPGAQALELMAGLSEHLLGEQADLLAEVKNLKQKLDHVKNMLSVHRTIAAAGGVDELFAAGEVVDMALRLSPPSLPDAPVEIRREFQRVPLLRGDKHKVLQILVNLISNARHAVQDDGREHRFIRIAVEQGGGAVQFVVSDNGAGIAPDARGKIFTHGFTTKEYGQGLGLHTSALLAREVGGQLGFESDGQGRGATFVLRLPLPDEAGQAAHRRPGSRLTLGPSDGRADVG